MALSPFHLAIPVDNLEKARAFYGGIFGCNEGRHADHWVDFDFYGHQLVCHLGQGVNAQLHNRVDADHVPVPHFGVVLEWDVFHALAQKLRAADVSFVIPPKIRFQGQVGEQATFFLYDPAGNALEFKAFKDQSQLFARVSG